MSSDYFKKLDFLTSIRYEEKLKVGSIDLPDPLDIAVRDSVFSDDTRNWPDLTFGDIYLYLVESTCWYTKEQFKSFKLLDGYNLFSSGKIKKILTYCAPRKVACVIVATVEAGQTLKKFYSSWIILNENGTVLSSHCTCMAGLGEACSHIAALLFAVETTVKLGLNKPSCTSVACKWKAVVQKVKPCKVAEMNFSKPSLKKRHCVYEDNVKVTKSCSEPDFSDEQVKSMRREIMAQIESSHLHTMFTDSDDTESADSGEEIEEETDVLLEFTAKFIYKDVPIDGDLSSITLNQGQTNLIERETRGQSQSQQWKDQRKGRITASYFGRVCKVKSGVERLVTEIMGDSFAPEGLPSLQWGRKKEKDALFAFEKVEKCKHKDFQITRSGLCILKDNPFIGASPDGFMSCSCCPDAVIEVKCPYSIRFEQIDSACSKKSFFLDSNKNLKVGHNYYYQVQGLMMVTGRRRCVFIVYTTKDMYSQVIYYDEYFANVVKAKLESFFKGSILPKLKQ